ncbi:MAG: 2-isopropylmalate synthase [Deltaproteobacteria bacterium]|nr:2-isopropylmalate synthase [Deltaproteobacteria bacterium]
MTQRIYIFDTTLRDGEQSPGASMNPEEKLRIAKQLEKLNVDVIEAGFPIASQGDFEAVATIAKEVRKPIIAGLARAQDSDIDRCWEAVKGAARPRIHTFIATSDIHLKHKLQKTRDEVLKEIERAVRRAKKYTPDVEFSAEDATRSNWDYLCKAFAVAIESGATTLNVPDTVGYTVPSEFGALIRHLRENVPGMDQVVISVHCHNDLGLAVPNSIAAIEAGARQIECTVNGIGERAGNASMEEIVMILKTRKDQLPYETGIVTEHIYPTSRLLSQITGMVVQPNKAIVGANAFAHEAGIHQHGVLQEKLTYEIMKPEDIGLLSNLLVMGKHSGRHAFRDRLKALGYDLPAGDLDKAFQQFKELADKKKEIYDEDLEAIVSEEILRIPEQYRLVSVHVTTGTDTQPQAKIVMEVEGTAMEGTQTGDGPVDAVYKTIAKMTKTKSKLLRYSVNAITGGTEAQGEVTVRLEEEGQTVIGQGAHTDILVASAKAYINGLNKMAYRKHRRRPRTGMVGP